MAGLATKIEIISNALILLGDNPLSSLTEDTTGAVLGANLYEQTYRAMLSSHRWRFAVKKLSLSKLSSKPNTGYSYAYSLPSDIVYLIKTDSRAYQIYGSEIHSNTNTLEIEYVFRVEEDKLPAYFIKAIEYNLAYQFAVPLTGDISKGEYYQRLYKSAIATARNLDSSQHPQETFQSSPYTEVRY